MIIGNIGMGVGFVMEGAYPHVGTIMAAQVLWGIAYTFTSGATQAWLAGEIGEDALTSTFLRAKQLGQIGALAAIVAAIGLAHIDLWVPIVAGGMLQVALGVWLIFAMPETGFTRVPAEERETWTAFRATARNGFGAIRRSRALVLLAVAAALAGAASEPFDGRCASQVPEGGALPVLGRMVRPHLVRHPQRHLPPARHRPHSVRSPSCQRHHE